MTAEERIARWLQPGERIVWSDRPRGIVWPRSGRAIATTAVLLGSWVLLLAFGIRCGLHPTTFGFSPRYWSDLNAGLETWTRRLGVIALFAAALLGWGGFGILWRRWRISRGTLYAVTDRRRLLIVAEETRTRQTLPSWESITTSARADQEFADVQVGPALVLRRVSYPLIAVESIRAAARGESAPGADGDSWADRAARDSAPVDSEDVLTRALEPGERIVWSDRPRLELGGRVRLKDDPSPAQVATLLLLIPYLCVLAVVGYWAVSRVVEVGARPIVLTVSIVGFGVVAFPGVLALGRFIWRRSGASVTLYAVTDRGWAIVATSGGYELIPALDPEAFATDADPDDALGDITLAGRIVFHRITAPVAALETIRTATRAARDEARRETGVLHAKKQPEREPPDRRSVAP